MPVDASGQARSRRRGSFDLEPSSRLAVAVTRVTLLKAPTRPSCPLSRLTLLSLRLVVEVAQFATPHLLAIVEAPHTLSGAQKSVESALTCGDDGETNDGRVSLGDGEAMLTLHLPQAPTRHHPS